MIGYRMGWVGDITYIPLSGAYLAVWMDGPATESASGSQKSIPNLH